MSEENPITDYCDILGQRYFQTLQHDFSSSLLIVRDAVSCRAAGDWTTKISAVGNQDWYRLVPSTLVATFPPDQEGILFGYKVFRSTLTYGQGWLVQDMQSDEHFQSSYLWSCRDPPVLRAEECFGLPAKDLTFDSAVQDWIRLNRIAMTRNMTGITVACVGGSTVGLYVHDEFNSEFEFYKHWDATRGADSVTWLYCHIAPGWLAPRTWLSAQ
nr:hypothetical protein CFP56_20409 [Quercus suber]